MGNGMNNSDYAQAGCGTLYVVATPIGNLDDITLRALETLKCVDWIAAEDTRTTKGLLQHYAISRPTISLHEHNELERIEQLAQRLQAGESGALVSDAGTPLINDPGFQLVKALRQMNLRVVPIPGASAVISALCAAGLPTDRFSYEGFLPARSSKRIQRLQGLEQDQRTLVFYESPHRIVDSLLDMSGVFGESRQLCLGRELTKQFEQFIQGSFTEVIEFLQQTPEKVRGEFVVMVAGAQELDSEVVEYDALLQTLLAQNLPVKQCSEIVAQYFGVKKKEVYQRALSLKNL